MVDISSLGIDEDKIREYKDKYGDDAERMLKEHFGNRDQQEGTGQQSQGDQP